MSNQPLPLEAWPRCCRAAFALGLAKVPDPSGRYLQCPDCALATRGQR